MPKKAKSVAVRGKVVAHNISPKGHVEGALVQTSDGVVQLNVPKHGTEVWKIGSSVDVPAEVEDDDGDHPVYTAAPASDAVTGVVLRLNYALHGEVNGYQLDNGTFVHVKPDGAKRYKLRIGDHITAQGPLRIGAAATVVEAERVTKTAK